MVMVVSNERSFHLQSVYAMVCGRIDIKTKSIWQKLNCTIVAKSPFYRCMVVIRMVHVIQVSIDLYRDQIRQAIQMDLKCEQHWKVKSFQCENKFKHIF